VKLPEVVGCLHPRHAKSLDLRLSTLEPLNSGIMQIRACKIGPVIFEYEYIRVLLTSKKWRLQREGRQSRRQGVEKKSDWLFHKPRSNYWLRVAASNLASQSPCLAGVKQSHCNPQ